MSLSHLERATAFKSRKFDLATNPQNRGISAVQRGYDVDQDIINTKERKQDFLGGLVGNQAVYY